MKLLDAQPAEGAQAPVTLETLPQALVETNGPLTLVAAPDVKVAELAPVFDRLGAIVVPFAAFRDGRGFSTASQLREAGYAGELRATGDLLADQARMLSRCGFDAVDLPAGAIRAEWEKALTVIDTAYQPAQDARTPVFLRRGAARDVPLVAADVQVDEASGSEPRATAAVLQTADIRPLRPARSQHASEVDRLNAALRGAPAQEILRAAIKDVFPGRIAVMSSFGTEAAISLHLVAQQDPSIPVLFLDTAKHFAPTLDYRDDLVARLKLTDVRTIQPSAADTRLHDPRGDLWRTNADLCCDVRKVRPLAEIAPEFDALITGRKRFHGAERLRLPVFEEVNGQIRVNPLANWTAEQLNGYFIANGLPRHPLVEAGYSSVGCYTCTEPNGGADVRGGRWAGSEKRECGIHLPSRWAAQLDQAS